MTTTKIVKCMGNSKLSGGSLLSPQDPPRRNDSKNIGSSNGQKQPLCHNVVYTKRSKKQIARHISYLRVAVVVAIQALDRKNVAEFENGA